MEPRKKLLRVCAIQNSFELRNILGWFISLLIRLIERKDYSHVYPELESGIFVASWDIPGWFTVWRRASSDALRRLYRVDIAWEIPLTGLEHDRIYSLWQGMIGRRYAVGRLILLPMYRLTRWEVLRQPPGVTCTNMIAAGLAEVGLWDHDVPADMAGLREVEEVVVRLQGRKVAE